ncbi:class II aldolase/adducin family protein [Plebeiibacterium sediminum]|uniref:Class II aldolase/adducin family protein n=1 Tax=Plebeiibacterium sediminum TaxID=2992112 RepID=A0AAE3M434_9BACT|nr:class II aldolase/adducin family protein [Plebeiobacterium sediminum]MCW3786683.1 class II aldolase/adducin family protein [Plebeiobacterium sediminum]
METKDLYLKERKEVARFMRRLYKKGLTTSLGGNISKRVGEHFLITPSEIDKGTLKAKNVIILDKNGNNLTQWITPSRETSMHLQIYKDHATINAIVHCHTIFASSFSGMDIPINAHLIAESRMIIKEPVVAPYGLLGTPELAKNVSETFAENKVLIMENHGITAIGSEMIKAFNRIEVLENAAKMTFITHLMNEERSLSEDQLEQIDNL